MKSNPTTELVSVVIPCRNSEATLAACIASIRQQTYPNVEIIVVDNHSADQTPQIASDLADVFLSAGDERSAQTNTGVRAASGSWVYRVDSDFIVDAEVIEQAVLLAERDNLGAVLIHNRSDPSISRWARAREFERRMYKNDRTNVAVRFIKRTIFLEVGGFDETLIAGEDYDLHLRVEALGTRIGEIAAGETHLGEPRSLAEVISKHYFYGGEMRRYVSKHPAEAKKQLNPVRPAFLRNKKLFVQHPFRAAEFFVYLIIKYIAGGLGYVRGPRKKVATDSTVHVSSR